MRRARHRGTYRLRYINLLNGWRMLHVPRPQAFTSSTLLVSPEGVAHILPFLAPMHGAR